MAAQAFYEETSAAFLAKAEEIYKNPGIGAVANTGEPTGKWLAADAGVTPEKPATPTGPGPTLV